MAKKKKSYVGTIRIERTLIQRRFASKQDRDEWYAKMRAQKMRAKAGLETEFEPIEIEHVAADFLFSRMANETYKHDKYRLETYFLPRFFGRMIHSITRREWKEALDDLIRVHGLKPKTHNNIRTLVMRLYKFAIQNEPRRAQTNPIQEIAQLPVMKEEIQFFHSDDECRRYLTHAQVVHPMFGMFAYIALNTGMREGEICSLFNECVNLDGGSIRIMRTWSHSQRKIVERTKGKRQRVIGINRTLSDAIKRHKTWSKFNEPTDLVVCDSKGRPFDSKHLWEMHSKAIKAAGLPYMNIHCLRHTFATQFLTKGGSIWDLKNILGHQSIKTTERYAHVVPITMKAKASIFEVGASDDTMMTTEVKKNAAS